MVSVRDTKEKQVPPPYSTEKAVSYFKRNVAMQLANHWDKQQLLPAEQHTVNHGSTCPSSLSATAG